MTKLFVGGFPLDISEIELVKIFDPYGQVSTIKIVRDKKTGKCKGYAFLEMISQEAAENAVESLNGYEIGDRKLTVNITEDKPIQQPTSRPSFKPRFTAPSRYVKVERPSADGSRPKRPRKRL